MHSEKERNYIKKYNFAQSSALLKDAPLRDLITRTIQTEGHDGILSRSGTETLSAAAP